MAHRVHKIRLNSVKLKADGRRQENKDGCQEDPARRLLLGPLLIVQVNKMAQWNSLGCRQGDGHPELGYQVPPWAQALSEICSQYISIEWIRTFDIKKSKLPQDSIGDSQVVEPLLGQSWDFPGLRFVWLGDQGSLRRRPWRGNKPALRSGLSLIPIRMAIMKRKKKKTKQKITSVGEDVEKQEPLCTVGGDAKWSSHCGKQYSGSSKD